METETQEPESGLVFEPEDQRLSTIKIAINEWREMPLSEKSGAVIRGLGCGALAAAGLAGVPLAAAMAYPFRFSGHIPPLAAAETFGVSVAWGVLDASIFKSFFGRFRKTAETLGGENVIEHAAKLLPGLSGEEAQVTRAAREKNKPRFYLGRLALRYSRGATVQSGLGTAAYMAAGTAQGLGDTELRELGVQASVDSALYLGSIMLVASTVADLMAHQDPALGNAMLHYAKDQLFWVGIAGTMTTYRLVLKNVFNKIFNKAKSTPEAEAASA